MTAKVILNPYSNRWNSQKRWPEAESALKSAGVDYDLAVSEKKGQIIDLAAQAPLGPNNSSRSVHKFRLMGLKDNSPVISR